jgi:hypothetical protein
MISGKGDTGKFFDNNKSTDIEVAIHLLKLMGTQNKSSEIGYIFNGKNPYVVMVEDALETMTNPFARKLLIDKMSEQ